MAKPKPGGRRPRKKERKNVTYGVAHIKSSFNNTIVSITDQEGNPTRGGMIGYALAYALMVSFVGAMFYLL